MYGTKDAALYDADYIVELDGDLYIGRLKPGYNRNGITDLDGVKALPIWQIEKITSVTEEIPQHEFLAIQGMSAEEIATELNMDNEGNYDDETTHELNLTIRTYPNGNEDYKFRMDICASYTYEFRH